MLNDGADLEETVPSQSDRRKQLRLGLCVPAGLAARRLKQVGRAPRGVVQLRARASQASQPPAQLR